MGSPQDTPYWAPTPTPATSYAAQDTPPPASAAQESSPRARAVGGGVLLIGLAALLASGWWWPGIMLVVGLAVAADRLVDGKVSAAVAAAAVFTCIPLVIWLSQHTDLPGTWVIALVLGGIGVAGLLRALVNRP